MPIVLEPAMYPSVSAVFEETSTHHFAVPSVLAGTVPGRIVVDDPRRPTAAALISSNPYRVFVGGEPSVDLLTDVIHLLYQPTPGQRFWFTVHYPSDGWKAAIDHVLQGLGSTQVPATLLPPV